MAVPKTVSARIEKAAGKISESLGLEFSTKRFWSESANALEALALFASRVPAAKLVDLAKERIATLQAASVALAEDPDAMTGMADATGIQAFREAAAQAKASAGEPATVDVAAEAAERPPARPTATARELRPVRSNAAGGRILTPEQEARQKAMLEHVRANRRRTKS